MPARSSGLWAYKRNSGGGWPAQPPPPAVYTRPPLVPMTQYVAYVADRRGVILGELQGALESVSWKADGYGTAAMILAPAAARVVAPLLEYGNRVLIEFDNGLPAWGGVIDPPREANTSQMRVQFYEAAYMLTWRVLERFVFGGATGRAATALVNIVAAADVGIGTNYATAAAGPVYEGEYLQETALAMIDRVRGLDAALHWYVEPRPSSSRLVLFELVTYRETTRGGGDDVVLMAGHNFVQMSTLEQGQIANRVSTSAAAGDTSEVYVATDSESVGRFGRRDLYFSTETIAAGEEEDAERQARERLAQTKTPTLRIQGTALNIEPGAYRRLRLGARARLESYAPPLAGSLSIVGMDFSPAAGTVSLVFDDASRVLANG